MFKKNGIQLGEENYIKFYNWFHEREKSLKLSEYFFRGKLNKSLIAVECGFDRKVFHTNPAVFELFRKLESDLSISISSNECFIADVLDAPHVKSSTPHVSDLHVQKLNVLNDKLNKRLKILEERNASLSAEIVVLRFKLNKLCHIENHLAKTGLFIKI